MTDFQKKFGLRIKELRKKAGLTQEKLAEMLDIGVRSLVKIETGAGFPSSKTIEKLILALNISPDKIFIFEHLQEEDDLKKITINLINSNPDKIKDIYKVVKALTE